MREEQTALMRVGFIGAGRMGAPMVRRLAAAGHQVRVLGRTEDKRRAVTDLGAVPVDGAPAAVEGAEAVVVCLFTDEQVRAVVDTSLLTAIPAGAVLIVHTTGSPRTVEHLRDAAPHLYIVDAPVSGGPHDIAAGEVTLFLGGTDDAVARALPVLNVYGSPVLHVGALGAGQKIKLINNTLFAAQIGLLAEAGKLAGSLGVDETALLAALPHGSGASRALDNVARAGSTGTFIAAVGDFIGKDVAVIRQTVAELGTDLGTLNAVVDAGLGR